MKDRPLLLIRLLAVCLALFVTGSFPIRADDPVFVLQLPLSRFSHGLTLYYVESATGMESSISPNLYQMAPAGSVDGNGVYQLATDSHLDLSFAIDSSLFSQWWLKDETTGESSQLNIADLRGSSWGVGQPNLPDMMPSYLQCFALSEGRLGNALVLVRDDGTTYPVTSGAILGYNVTNPDNSTSFQSYGFFNAWAYPDSTTQSLQLVDLTAHQQAPAGSTELIAGSLWGPITRQSVFAVNILLPSEASQYSFTFHTSQGSLQGVFPTYSTMYLPDGSWQSGCIVSGVVGAGENFWLTRDADGASTPHGLMLFSDLNIADWTAYFPHMPNWQTLTFKIGQERDAHTLAVVHSDGTTNYLYTPPWTWYRANYFTIYDQNNAPVDYYYTIFEAPVDVSLSWQLWDLTTQEDLGAVTSRMDGYNPDVLRINEERAGHTFYLRDTQNNIYPIINGETFQSYYLTVNYPQQHSYEVRYFNATVSLPSNVWDVTLVDQTTGEEILGNRNSVKDQAQWYLPPTPLNLNISVTRWSHELLLCQPDGSSYLISRGNLQGSWSPDAQNRPWFITYGYFDAPTQARSSEEWWVYDVSTGEVSAANSTDLMNWHGSDSERDTDFDGLVDWYEFILGTNNVSSDTDDDGVSDLDELLAGTSFNDPSPVLTVNSPAGATLVP